MTIYDFYCETAYTHPRAFFRYLYVYTNNNIPGDQVVEIMGKHIEYKNNIYRLVFPHSSYKFVLSRRDEMWVHYQYMFRLTAQLVTLRDL